MRPTTVAIFLTFASLTLVLSFWNMTSPVSNISITPAKRHPSQIHLKLSLHRSSCCIETPDTALLVGQQILGQAVRYHTWVSVQNDGTACVDTTMLMCAMALQFALAPIKSKL